MKEQEWPQNSIAIFQHLRAAYSAVRGRIWTKFLLIQDIIVGLVTCKNTGDQLKTKALEWPQQFSRRSRATNSTVVCGRIWPKFELSRDIIILRVTAKNEKDQMKLCHKSCHNIYAIITLWVQYAAIETRVLIQHACFKT